MHPIEVALKRINMPGPVFPERREPGVDFEQRLGLETVDPALGIHLGLHEAGVPQNLQVFRDSGLGQTEMAFQLANGLFRSHELIEDGAAGGLREDGKG
jgi:hypothetical protein